MHANGDRAIRLLLDAHDKARREGAAGSPIRHRIEHCSLVDDQIIAHIHELGLVIVPFGSYARFHGDKLPGYYGHERLERMFAHRSFLDAGVPVAGSSDYPCGPGEPLAAITSCVERRSLDGEFIGGSQRISVAEAIALYTTGSAYASGEEHRKGRWRPACSPTSSSCPTTVRHSTGRDRTPAGPLYVGRSPVRLRARAGRSRLNPRWQARCTARGAEPEGMAWSR